MYNLAENVYNQNCPKNRPKLKIWKYAGLLLTYQCPAACACCYYNCSPEKNSIMSVETAVGAWQSLVLLSGDAAKVHITGGEPFLCFDRLSLILTEARKAGLSPLDTLETNGFWARTQKEVEEKIKFLDSAGLCRLKISWDPFHAEFIDIESVRLLAKTAGELLGKDRVLVRWEKYLQDTVDIRRLCPSEKTDLYKSSMHDYPIRFTGRAAGELASLCAQKTPAQLGRDCSLAFLDANGVHIDPYGNVFNGQCSGITIGNVNRKPLEKIWTDFNPPAEQFISVLFGDGPAGLLATAGQYGYKAAQYYADKCHLCTQIRQFFFDKGEFRSIISPKDIYENNTHIPGD